MKKQTMVSALSLTAALAAPLVSFPQYSLARSVSIEKHFAQKFMLQGSVPVRYTNADGLKILGRIYLKLDQTPFTPNEQNQLHAEMTGVLYFESDEAIEKYFNGEPHKTWMALAGDGGDILVDLTHHDREGFRTYQIYGCNTTVENCKPENYKLYFEKKSVHLDFHLPEQFEALVEVYEFVDGKQVQVKKWVREGYIQMQQIPDQER